MTEQYYVYIMTNEHNTVVYVGVTGDLVRRVYEHKQKFVEGFTKKFNIEKLVYYETTNSIEAAINRKKQMKKGSRKKKVELIDQMNPKWEDLYEHLH